jgi:hypothetical protein
MNEQLIRETARVGLRGFACFFSVMMCCISSDASLFHARWPLFVGVSEPVLGPEK